MKGIVQDTDGKPVWGINVQVDGQSTYSDSAGHFFVRFRRGEQYPLTVVPGRSLNTRAYEVVQAPVSVLAEPEEQANPVVIIVTPLGEAMRAARKAAAAPAAPVEPAPERPNQPERPNR